MHPTGLPGRLKRLLAWPLGIPRRAAVLAAVVALGVALALSERAHARIVEAFALVEPLFAREPVLGTLLFVVLAALSAVLVFFSGVVLVPVGISTWGHAGCFLLLWGGWILGGLATYLVGRRLGRPVVRWLLPAGALARYESAIPARGSLLTTALIQLALPSDIAGYFFGLLGYEARVYLGALALAELPYALGAVFLGSAFMERRLWPLVTVGVAAVAALAWGRRRRRRHHGAGAG